MLSSRMVLSVSRLRRAPRRAPRKSVSSLGRGELLGSSGPPDAPRVAGLPPLSSPRLPPYFWGGPAPQTPRVGGLPPPEPPAFCGGWGGGSSPNLGGLGVGKLLWVEKNLWGAPAPQTPPGLRGCRASPRSTARCGLRAGALRCNVPKPCFGKATG